MAERRFWEADDMQWWTTQAWQAAVGLQRWQQETGCMWMLEATTMPCCACGDCNICRSVDTDEVFASAQRCGINPISIQ